MFSASMYVSAWRMCVGSWLLAMAGTVKTQNKENEDVLAVTLRLLFNAALLFWLLGAVCHFPLQSQIQVGESPLESFPLALKPPSQAAVLGMDANTASSQVKPRKGKVQSCAHSLGIRLESRRGKG